MRIIAIIKKCSECEKNLILSSVEKEDKVLFFDNEEELLKSEDYVNVEIVFGEPQRSTIDSMKNLRWIQMTWAGANKYTSAPNFPDNIILTSASGAYGCVISEYIIKLLMAIPNIIAPIKITISHLFILIFGFNHFNISFINLHLLLLFPFLI